MSEENTGKRKSELKGKKINKTCWDQKERRGGREKDKNYGSEESMREEDVELFEKELCEDNSVVHPHYAAALSLAKAVFIHWFCLNPAEDRERDMNGTCAELTGLFVSGSHLN